MKRLGMLQRMSFVVGAAALAAMGFTACGDDDNGTTYDARVNFDAPITFDATVRDAPTPDARLPDAPTADAAPTFSGTMAIHDIEIFGLAAAGHGNQITVDFNQNGIPTFASASIPDPLGLPCNASVVDTTVAAMNNPDVDEGTVTFTRTPAGGAATALPACNFVGPAGSGTYRCLNGMGASGTITATANPAVGTFSNATNTFKAEDVGAYLIVTSGTGAGSAWPIVGINGMTAGIQNTGAAFPATTGTFIVQHGVGPIALTANTDGTNPGLPPERLANDDMWTVQLTPKTGSHFAAYTSPAFGAGDKFTLDTASTTVFTDGLNFNTTTPVVLGCDATACPQLSALVTVVNIETTDAAGGGPTELLTPTKFRGSLTCASLNNTVSIDPSLFAVLKMGNPKKYRISVFRDGGDLSAVSRRLSVVAGHGIVVFKAVP